MNWFWILLLAIDTEIICRHLGYSWLFFIFYFFCILAQLCLTYSLLLTAHLQKKWVLWSFSPLSSIILSLVTRNSCIPQSSHIFLFPNKNNNYKLCPSYITFVESARFKYLILQCPIHWKLKELLIPFYCTELQHLL